MSTFYLDYEALGKRIRNARKEANLTQAELGEACSLSTSHIGHIERGSRILSVDTLFNIAMALNVSLDYLAFDAAINQPVDDVKSTLIHIESMLKNKDKNRTSNYLKTIRVLADNIDKL